MKTECYPSVNCYQGMEEHLAYVIDIFSSVFTVEQYPKHHLLHREGTVCHRLYVVKSGALRSFYHQDGKDITAHFAIDRGVITAVDSFLQQKPSRYNVETLEDSTVYVVSRQDFDRFLDEHPEHERAVRLVVQDLYIELVERVENLIFFSAQERYERLIRHNPNIIQRVSLGHIASFLGITPETLSRVRSTGSGGK